MSKNNGFGLLELVVVIGVFAIVTAIAMPGVLSWRAKAELRSVSEDLRKAMKLAKSRAVREAKPVIADFKTDNYTIFMDTGDGGGGPPNARHDPQEPLVYQRQLPQSIQLELIDPATGNPPAPPSAAPIGSAAYNDLMDVAIAGGLFPMGFDFDKWENEVAFLPSGTGTEWVVFLPNDGGVPLGNVDSPFSDPDQILFDRKGSCLNPINVILVNVKGQRFQIEITAYGIGKATQVDDES